ALGTAAAAAATVAAAGGAQPYACDAVPGGSPTLAVEGKRPPHANGCLATRCEHDGRCCNAAVRDRGLGKPSRHCTVEPCRRSMDEPAPAANAPAVEETSSFDPLAHTSAAEYDRLRKHQARIIRKF